MQLFQIEVLRLQKKFAFIVDFILEPVILLLFIEIN